MRLEYISTKTIDFKHITGKKICFYIEDKSNSTDSILFYADEKIIGITAGKKDSFIKGNECHIELPYKENVLKINCKIKRFTDGVLYLDVPRQASIIQKRKDLRINSNIKCEIERFSTGKIKNLSAGGAYIELDKPLDYSLINKDKFKLCFTLNNVDLRITCGIIEAETKYLRAQFKDLNEETKEFLTLYCCSADAENYRRSKNER